MGNWMNLWNIFILFAFLEENFSILLILVLEDILIKLYIIL